VRAALSGLRAWLVQRVTAVYLTGFTGYVAARLALAPPETLAEWSAWVRGPVMSTATALFFCALLLHAWVGVRDVVLDYVHHAGLRLGALALLALALAAQALWALRVLFGGGA
jgi:succinate dehydrogenase / fumarate reductase membrane anchor subunit